VKAVEPKYPADIPSLLGILEVVLDNTVVVLDIVEVEDSEGDEYVLGSFVCALCCVMGASRNIQSAVLFLSLHREHTAAPESASHFTLALRHGSQAGARPFRRRPIGRPEELKGAFLPLNAPRTSTSC